MRVCLFIAGVFVLFNTAVASGAWHLLSRHATRPKFARAAGALAGAAAAAWITRPELNYIFEWTCKHARSDPMCDGTLPLPVLYLYPFALPVTIGLSTWLFAEVIGGRTRRPLFEPLVSVLGALLVSALVFLPLIFVQGLDHMLPRAIVQLVTVGVPASGALLGLAVAQSDVVPLARRKRL